MRKIYGFLVCLCAVFGAQGQSFTVTKDNNGNPLNGVTVSAVAECLDNYVIKVKAGGTDEYRNFQIDYNGNSLKSLGWTFVGCSFAYGSAAIYTGTTADRWYIINPENKSVVEVNSAPNCTELKVDKTDFLFSTCGSVPAATQSFIVNGKNLSDDITISIAGSGAAYYDFSPKTIAKGGGTAGATITVTLKADAPVGAKDAIISIKTGDLEKTIQLSGYVTESAMLQHGSLSGNLDYDDCNGTLPTGSIKLRGHCLDNNVVVKAPNNFEVSVDGTAWSDLITLTDATFTTDIQVRLKEEGLWPNTTYTGDVEITTGGKTEYVPVSAASKPVRTSIIPNKNVVYNLFGDGTAAQSITVTGTGLTANITAKAPAGFEISLTEGGTYGATVDLPREGGTVWVRPKNYTSGLVRGNVTFSSPTATGVEKQTVEVMHGAEELCTVTSTTPSIPEGKVFVCNGTFSIAHDVEFVVEGELHLTAGYKMNSGTLYVAPSGAVIIQEEFIMTTGKNSSGTRKKVEVINEGIIELRGTPAKGKFQMASNLDNNSTTPSLSSEGLYFSNYGNFGISNAEVIMGQNNTGGTNGGAFFYNQEGAIVFIDNKDFPERKVYFGGKNKTLHESILLSRPGVGTSAAAQQKAALGSNAGYFNLHLNEGSLFVVKHTDVDMIIGQPGDGEQKIAGELYVYNGNLDIAFQNGIGGQAPTIAKSGGLYVIDETPSDCHQTGMLNIHAGGGNMKFIVEGNMWATGFDGANSSKSGSNEVVIKPGGTGFVGNVGANMPSENYKIHVEGEGTLYYCGNWSEYGDAVGDVDAGGTLFWAPTYYKHDNEGSPTDTNDEGTLVIVVAKVGSSGVSGGHKIEVLEYDGVETIKAYLTYTNNGKTWNYPKTYSLCTTCLDSDRREFFTINPDGSFKIRTLTVGDFSVSKGATSDQMKDFNGNLISTADECEKLFLTTPPEKNTPQYSWLPVTLISFKATATAAGGARVQWITQTETNNDYFTLYRSYNGIVFEPIATVAGAGTTTVPQFYEYNDKNFISNIAYYQLGQTDFNGKETMSTVVAVQNMYLPTFEIEKLQNNGNGNYTITFLFPDTESENNITIYSVTSVKKAQYNFAAGTMSTQVEAKLYPSGTYIVEHVAGNRKTVKKIVIQ